MRILRFGLELKRIGEEDLELVRSWRNADHVRREFEFQDEISDLDQVKWFNELNMETNYYFLVSHEATPFTVIHLKQIDWENRTAEAGIFTGNKDFLETPWPVFSILALMEFAFGPLRLNSLECKIRNANHSTESMNQKLGYTMLEGEQEKPYRRFAVKMIDFYTATAELRNMAEKMGGSVNVLEADPVTTRLLTRI